MSIGFLGGNHDSFLHRKTLFPQPNRSCELLSPSTKVQREEVWLYWSSLVVFKYIPETFFLFGMCPKDYFFHTIQFVFCDLLPNFHLVLIPFWASLHSQLVMLCAKRLMPEAPGSITIKIIQSLWILAVHTLYWFFSVDRHVLTQRHPDTRVADALFPSLNVW